MQMMKSRTLVERCGGVADGLNSLWFPPGEPRVQHLARCKQTVFVPCALMVAAFLLLPVSPLIGADQSWTGSSSPFWTDPGNWGSGVAPVPGDNLLFTLNNFSNHSNYNDFPAGTTFGSITIGEGNTVQYILAVAPIVLTNGITEYGSLMS